MPGRVFVRPVLVRRYYRLRARSHRFSLALESRAAHDPTVSGGVCGELLILAECSEEVHKMQEIRNRTLGTQQLPILKRDPFRDENEFRMIYESPTEELEHLDIGIPLSCITGITLSRWLPHALLRNMREVLNSIDSCSNLKNSGSTLIKNEEWYNHGKSATHQRRSLSASPSGRKSPARGPARAR